MAIVVRRGDLGPRRRRRRPSLWRLLGFTAIGVGLLLIAVGLILGRLLFYLPPEALPQATQISQKAEGTIVEAPKPPETKEATRRIRSLSSPEGPTEVRLSEEEVNALLRERLPDYFVRNPWVNLEPDRIKLSGLVNVKGKWVYIEAEGGLSLEGLRRVRFAPERVKVGKMYLPGFLRRRIERKFGPFFIELPVPVGSIEVEEQALLLRRHGLQNLLWPSRQPLPSTSYKSKFT